MHVLPVDFVQSALTKRATVGGLQLKCDMIPPSALIMRVSRCGKLV